MQKELLKEYAFVRINLRALEAEEELLREKILDSLLKEQLDKVESVYGDFTVAKKVAWEYTDKVKKIEERLKITKAKEQDRGIAKSKVINYLLFKKADEN